MKLNLSSYIKAGYPILWINSHEEGRVEYLIEQTLAEINAAIPKGSPSPKKISRIWSETEGFFGIKKVGNKFEYDDPKQIEDPNTLLETIKAYDKANIFILRDFHVYLGEPRIRRYLRDIARDFKQDQKTVIIISPTNKIPLELQKEITIIDYDLPNKSEIGNIWASLWASYGENFSEKISEDEQEKIIQSAMGLTINEAENAFAKAIVECNHDTSKIAVLVLNEKAIAVKKSGILEYFDTTENIDSIGGLKYLKDWLLKRKSAFTKKAREYNLPLPKGIVMLGMPGTGKSLTAKAIAAILGLPLLRFDIGKVFGGLVGESEANMRQAIQTAEAVGSCVLWIDEMEKAFAGMNGSGTTDGGTGKRIFGNFLTWMQEKKVPVFIVATINSLQGLPPELLRKGRFDEIFYIDLPDDDARKEIFDIQIKSFNRDPKIFNFQDCVEASQSFSGAEIRGAVESALFDAFHNGLEITEHDILQAVEKITPLSKSKGEDLEKMKKWAEANAVNASTEISSSNNVKKKIRKIAI